MSKLRSYTRGATELNIFDPHPTAYMWQNRYLSKIVTNVSWWVCFRHRCDQAMFVMTWILTLFNASRNDVMNNRR